MSKPLSKCRHRLPGLICQLTGKDCAEKDCPFNH